jgi:dihydroorotate dehydrogenase electron transfer subunit
VTESDRDETRPLRRSQVTRAVGEVIATRRVGAYQHLTLVAPGVTDLARPGQFVAFAVGGPGSATMLRRPLFIHRASASGTYGGTVEVVVDRVGMGTQWLADRRPHASVDLVGPLGHGFPLPRDPESCVLVGEEWRSAPLLWLASSLRARGCPVEMVLGAATEPRLFGVVEARRSSDGVTVTTRDGSAGVQGTVLDVLPDVLQRTDTSVVYASASVPLLQGVAAAAAERGAVCQVAIDGGPGCGIGVCHGCVVPVVGSDGVARTVRGCTEGPVFAGERVQWASLAGER